MRRRLFAVITTLALNGAASAQDIHFSQFYETSILRNPALTGVFAGDYKLGALYKSQWNTISTPFQTAVVSAETRFSVNRNVADFISFGLLASYDRAGTTRMQTLTVYPAVNYNKLMNDEHSTYLSAGFTGGFIQRSFDLTRATFNNQYQNNAFDPSASSGEQNLNSNINQWDLGAGISYSSNTGINNQTNYFFGVSGYHFTKPRSSYFNNENIRIGMKINVTAGVSAPIGENYSVQAYINYANQAPYSELIGGGLFGWHKKAYEGEGIIFGIYGGVFYRLNDAVVPTVKVKIKEYAIGLSYDVSVSSLSKISNMQGGYELTLFKTGLFKDPNRQRSKTICPHAVW
ncbi:MAG: type IX secretion system membrane protein PorP/SprF [Sphingobacteriales bacterium]|nr:MAG: type IX secretion system membrane protein PorP/SprF [Sphingobacteriales bacterium]